MEDQGRMRGFGGVLWLLVIVALLFLFWFLRPGGDNSTATLDANGNPVATAAEEATSDPDDILVDLRDNASPAQVAALEADLGIDLVLVSDQSADEQFYRAHVDPARRDAILAALEHRPEVELAEPDATYQLIDEVGDPATEVNPSHEGYPNDPMY